MFGMEVWTCCGSLPPYTCAGMQVSDSVGNSVGWPARLHVVMSY